MILGIGADLCRIDRIEKTLARFGERFISRVFTAGERAKAEGQANRAATYAKRFAAKEACAKALGTGLSMGTAWREMEVVNLPTGQPTLQLHGKAAERLASLTPSGHHPHLYLTLTDDYPLAQAFLVIEARKDQAE